MSTASFPTQITLKGATAQEFSEWFSIWNDLLHTRQALFDRSKIDDLPVHIFTRRAIWEGAAIAYGRCYKTGRRRALLKKLLDGLTPEQRARHEETIHWRDKHIGHRVDPDLEKSVAVGTIADGKLLNVEGKITTSSSPAESAIKELEDLASVLMDRVWETQLIPLELKLRAEF